MDSFQIRKKFIQLPKTIDSDMSKDESHTFVILTKISLRPCDLLTSRALIIFNILWLSKTINQKFSLVIKKEAGGAFTFIINWCTMKVK